MTASFAHTTAAGQLLVDPLPFTPDAEYIGALSYQGITRAGKTQFFCATSAGGAAMSFEASGSGTPIVSIMITDLPSGGVVVLRCTSWYRAL